jgi:spermidine/putrescine-binding protein
MSKKVLFNVLALVVVLSLTLAACGGNSTGPAGSGDIVTSTGFVCPAPEPRMEVTSKSINLFVWTEYFPTDMLECFELVYGIKINRDEYSSNEEMYAKISAGGSNYDLVQPTDYMISLMARQGYIQPLDHSKLPNIGNMDPNYMNPSTRATSTPCRIWPAPMRSFTMPTR